MESAEDEVDVAEGNDDGERERDLETEWMRRLRDNREELDEDEVVEAGAASEMDANATGDPGMDDDEHAGGCRNRCCGV